jgi:hypothetical protein
MCRSREASAHDELMDGTWHWDGQSGNSWPEWVMGGYYPNHQHWELRHSAWSRPSSNCDDDGVVDAGSDHYYHKRCGYEVRTMACGPFDSNHQLVVDSPRSLSSWFSIVYSIMCKVLVPILPKSLLLMATASRTRHIRFHHAFSRLARCSRVTSKPSFILFQGEGKRWIHD